MNYIDQINRPMPAVQDGKQRRRSKKREAILSAIRMTTSHPTAEWIYAKLKPELPDLSLATVYRNIAEFKASGEVIAVAQSDGGERIDADLRPHAHLVCEVCGGVSDIWQVEELFDLDHTAARLTGGEIKSHSLTYHGRCEACLNKTKN